MGWLAATAVATFGAPGPAWACAVCFTSERNGSLLLAYYLTTALLTTVALGVLATFLGVLLSRYGHDTGRDRASAASARDSPAGSSGSG